MHSNSKLKKFYTFLSTKCVFSNNINLITLFSGRIILENEELDSTQKSNQRVSLNQLNLCVTLFAKREKREDFREHSFAQYLFCT